MRYFTPALVLLATLCPAQQTIATVGKVGPAKKLHGGFAFVEGPAADFYGNVYFTDVRNNRIHRIMTDGKLSTFLENSQGCNGLMVRKDGKLIACQGGTKRVIAIDLKTKKINVLARATDAQPLNRPNDLTLDRHGGVYFTDPSFGRRRGPARGSDPVQGVYYVSRDGERTCVVKGLIRPNGTLLSKDEKHLYVLPSNPQDGLRVHPVLAPGKVGPGKRVSMEIGAGDGLTTDVKGNLYLTPRENAILVVSPKGRVLGKIPVPERPSNCTFGGADMRTLFITARTSVYTVKMPVRGHRYWEAKGKKKPRRRWL